MDRAWDDCLNNDILGKRFGMLIRNAQIARWNIGVMCIAFGVVGFALGNVIVWGSQPEPVNAQIACEQGDTIHATDQSQPRISNAGSAVRGDFKPTTNACKNYEESASDRWLMRWTGLLVLVGAIQAALFFYQLWLIASSIKDADRTARASTKQAAIAQKTFEKLERPYLYVTIKNTFQNKPLQMTYSHVEYSVFNYGKIAAKIDEVYIQNGTSVGIEPSDALLIDLDDDLMANRVLGPAESRMDIESIPPLGINWVTPPGQPGVLIPDITANDSYFFTIRIVYSGPFTKGHVTTACWRWQMIERTFQEFGHSKFNFMT